MKEMRVVEKNGGRMTLLQALVDLANKQGDAPALFAPGRKTLDRAALIEALQIEIKWMRSFGLGRGKRVAVVAPPGVETAIALLATASNGVCVPLNPAATGDECFRFMQEGRVDALRVSPGQGAGARQAAERLGLIILEEGVSAPAGLSGAATEPVMPDDVALLMGTSGTTSRPKIVPITHRQILARAVKSQELLGLSESDRCLNLMPLCYMHGLNSGLFGPLLSGGAGICPESFTQDNFIRSLKDFRATWYTAGATHQRAIMAWLKERPEMAENLSLRFVRSGSSPLPGSVRMFLEKTLNVPMVESYSSTETGTMTANPPFGKRKAGSVGCGSAEELAILGEDGQPLPAGMTGEVAVRGDCVFAGYEADGTIDRSAFRNGWFCTGDIGQIDQDGYLTLSGRIKDIINRGGEKVSPAEVDAVLLQHGAVVEAATFAVPHPSLHEDVVAVVVLQPGRRVSERALQDYVARHLAAYKIPRRIIAAGSIPKTPTGKIARSTLADAFAGALAESRTKQPETVLPMLDALLSLWRIVLGREDIGPNDNFFQAGGDSLSAVALLLHIDRRLQTSLAVDDLARYPTPIELVQAMIRQEVGRFRDVMSVHPEGGRTPLFAVCGRFGYALRLIPLAHQLDAGQPFYALQPPGMDWATVGCAEVSAMAAHYIRKMRAIQPDGPYRLLGTSFGGLIVYEMAIQLQAQGVCVDRLILVDSAPPSLALAGRVVNLAAKPLEKKELDQSTQTAAAGVRVARQHYRARNGYRATERFKGAFYYFYCLGEPVAPARDKRRLWRRLATGGVRYIGLAGLHGCFHSEPQFSDFCRNLRECLTDTPPAGMSAVEVFSPSWRLCDKGGQVILRGESGGAFPVQEKVSGRTISVRIVKGELILSGYVDGGTEAAPRVLVFMNGRFIGHCDCAYPAKNTAKAGNGGMWRYPGFVFRHFLSRKLPEQSKLQVFVLLAHRTQARRLGEFVIRKERPPSGARSQTPPLPG